MSSSTQENQLLPATEVISEEGGGDYGAPHVDATRPKPSIGGPEVAAVKNPWMQSLTIWSQMEKMSPGNHGAGVWERAASGLGGPEEFREGHDSKIDVELPKVDLEEEGIMQKQIHPCSMIMLVYSLDRPSPRALFENIQDGWRLKEDLDYAY